LLNRIRELLFETDDLAVRTFDLNGEDAFLIYLETLCDPSKLEISLFKQWFQAPTEQRTLLPAARLVTAAQLKSCPDPEQGVQALLQSQALIGTSSQGWYAFNAEQSHVRSIQEPVNERSIVGERAGFVETLSVNLNLIRGRSSSPSLKIRYLRIGRTNKKAAVVWIEGVADPQIAQSTITRLSSISTAMEVHPGRLLSQLQERKISVFPQVYSTERIDMATNLIMQGRVAVLCEQSSTCLIVPVSFYTFLHSVDAVLLGRGTAIILRGLRAIGLFLSFYICSLYIAVTSFHYEVLPSKMSINIKGSLENVPYPPIIEALLMILIFQLIAEATIRLPSQIAQMVGVTGGIIISESLVKIGFVSNVFIVIVSLSVIGSFLLPTYQLRISSLIIQLLFVFGASVLGFYGIVFVTAVLLTHFLSLEPFGVPYCLPIRSRNQ